LGDIRKDLKKVGLEGVDLIQCGSEQGPVAGPCVYGDESLGSIRGEFK
jgi:hypothetical protein